MARLVSWVFSLVLHAGVLGGIAVCEMTCGLQLPQPVMGPMSLLVVSPLAPGPPDNMCEYRGDVGGYARSSRVVRKLAPDAAEAFLMLANAKGLCDSSATSRARVPASVACLRRLARDPLAVEVFRELAATATPAGRLYGLAGLYHADRVGFSTEAERYARLNSTYVYSVSGRSWRRLAFSEVVGEIARGCWATSLLT